jgi:arylsulfatase A-like enzyme
MFVVDDMRQDDLAYMPNTRHLIGSAGTTWTNSLAPYPLCCPARASIFSGEYSHNHHVLSHLPPYGFHAFHDSSTLATWLHAAGYQTALLGKYLNGYGSQPRPGQSRGVSVHYTPPGWDDWRGAIDGGLAASNPKNGGAYRYWDTTLSENRGRGLVALSGTYQTYAYGGILSRMIPAEAASDRPFFTYAAFTAPHVGMPREPDDPAPATRDDGKVTRMGTPGVPAALRGRFDGAITKAPGADWLDPDPTDKPEELQANPPPNDAEKAAMLEATRQRAESLYAVDQQIAKVIQQLARTGELEETYVLFTSDNGYFLGEQGIRQGKILPYDPALRTPLLIRGPGIPAGQVRTDPFLSIDFAPTILQMAGVPIPASVDGAGMLPVAQHGDRGWSRPVLVNTGPASVVRDTDESGVPIDPEDPGAADQRYLLGVRTGRYLFTDRADGFQELYDLQTDPAEYANLIADPAYAHVVAELRAELQAIRACAAATCRRPLPTDLRTPPGG